MTSTDTAAAAGAANTPGTGDEQAKVAKTGGTMKFSYRIKVGVNSGPLGVTTKTFPFTIDAASLQEARQKSLEIYVGKFGAQPDSFASFQETLSLDTGA